MSVLRRTVTCQRSHFKPGSPGFPSEAGASGSALGPRSVCAHSEHFSPVPSGPCASLPCAPWAPVSVQSTWSGQQPAPEIRVVSGLLPAPTWSAASSPNLVPSRSPPPRPAHVRPPSCLVPQTPGTHRTPAPSLRPNPSSRQRLIPRWTYLVAAWGPVSPWSPSSRIPSA